MENDKTVPDCKSDTKSSNFQNYQEITPCAVLDGRYRVIKKIGDGGMGIVYFGIDLSSGDRIAIKQFSNITDEKSLLRFKREYFLLWKSHHENIVNALDFVFVNGSYFLIMEYLDGKTLKEVLKDNELTIKEKYNIATQLTEAVRHINILGIIHRDIKPGNIMIVGNNKVKLLDLGLGKSMRMVDIMLTQIGDIIGTPEYLSPEQTIGEIATNTDVFSLSTVLYQMFGGLKDSPFKGQNSYECIVNVTIKNPKPLAKIVKQKNEAIQLISLLLEKGMRKRSVERISIEKFAEELNRIKHII